MFHFENIYAFIGFIVNWLWNLKNFSIIKVGNKYVWNQLTNYFFKPTFILQAKYTWISMWKNENPQVHFFYQPPLVAASFLKLMLKLDFPLVMAHVKASWEKSTKDPMDELQGKFPNHKLMFALGMIYPKFWFENPNLDSISVWLL